MTDWGALPTSGTVLGLGLDLLVDGAGCRLHAVSLGSGPLVLLLHGFPDFSYGWRHQLAAIAGAGYRAVALDLRGYNLSGRPARVEEYGLAHLVADVVAVIDALGVPAHAVVGHDWGGVIAWRLAAERPHKLQRLVIANAPHPARFRELLGSSTQALRSWYVGAVQLPALPEWLLCRDDLALLARALRAEHERPGALTPHDVEVYKRAFREPGALTAALAYYRAAVRAGADVARGTPRIAHPTLLVWGLRDGALVPGNADRLERWVSALRVERVAEARHFVQSDAPERFNAALLAFLATS